SLYAILTATPPHKASSSKEVFVQARHGYVVPPKKATPDFPIPHELEALCLRAMAPHPEDRLGPAEAVVQALKAHLSGAAQRQESEQITRTIAQSLDEGNAPYHTYSRGLEALARAEGQWANNPAIPELRERLTQEYARLALRQRDLRLARVLAESLEE